MAGVPVRVLIADDQKLMAAGTAAALDARDGFELVGLATDADMAAELAAAERPDVALVSVLLTGGPENAVREIVAAAPGTRVLAHSGPSDHECVMAMLRAGASGYVVRDAAPEKLQAAVRRAAGGEAIFDDVMLIAARGAKRARIRSVMEEDRLEIVFQPIVALDSRDVVGYEALSRFKGHPQRGPDRWFQEAHEVGLGAEL